MIVCELGKGDVLGPGCGMRSTEDSEIGLDFLVDMFSFAVSLRMVSSGDSEFIAEEFCYAVCVIRSLTAHSQV